MDLEKSDFLNRVSAVYDRKELSELTDDEVLNFLGVAQYAMDTLLVEAERRGQCGYGESGAPFIPYNIPEDVPEIETILMRGPGVRPE